MPRINQSLTMFKWSSVGLYRVLDNKIGIFAEEAAKANKTSPRKIMNKLEKLDTWESITKVLEKSESFQKYQSAKPENWDIRSDKLAQIVSDVHDKYPIIRALYDEDQLLAAVCEKHQSVLKALKTRPAQKILQTIKDVTQTEEFAKAKEVMADFVKTPDFKSYAQKVKPGLMHSILGFNNEGSKAKAKLFEPIEKAFGQDSMYFEGLAKYSKPVAENPFDDVQYDLTLEGLAESEKVERIAEREAAVVRKTDILSFVVSQLNELRLYDGPDLTKNGNKVQFLSEAKDVTADLTMNYLTSKHEFGNKNFGDIFSPKDANIVDLGKSDTTAKLADDAFYDLEIFD